MIRDRLERIRERAFALWEGAGRHHGHDEAHWHQATSQIDTEDALAPVSAPAAKRPAKAVVPKTASDNPAGKAKTAKAVAKPAKPASAKPQSGGVGKSRQG